jgi:hypothetical protein
MMAMVMVAAVVVVVMMVVEEDRAVDTKRTSGQAMIEVMAGLVALIVLIAGLLQVASLTRAQTDAMVEARQEAGTLALLEEPFSEFPDYIQDIQVGPDGRSYSHDDTTTDALPSEFNQDITERVTEQPSDWDVIDALPNSPLSSLHNAFTPATEFGLLKGDASETITLLPAVINLLYSADEITVESDVWMTWTRGIY